MKYLIALTLLAIGLSARAETVGLNNKLSAVEPKAWLVYGSVPLTNQLSSVASTTNFLFTTATFYAYQNSTATNPPVGNSNVAYWGVGGKILGAITTNAPVTITALPGEKFDLTNFLFTTTTNPVVSTNTADKVLILLKQ